MLLIVMQTAAAFAMQKSIEPVDESGRIDNAGPSVAIEYEGSPADVYYGSKGIFIFAESGRKHLDTAFGVKKLIDAGDINGDGFTDFITYQDAPRFASQIYAIDGKDGSVISELRLTRQDYDDNLGYVEVNSYIQQLLPAQDGCFIVVRDYELIKADLKSGSIVFTHTESNNIWKAASAGDTDGDGTEDFAVCGQDNLLALISGADGSVLDRWSPAGEYIASSPWNPDIKPVAVMNVWDVLCMDGAIYALTEDGRLVRAYHGMPEPEYAELGIPDPAFLQQYISNYRQEYFNNSWTYNQTGVLDWNYMGFRFADVKDGMLLIDCYMGSLDGVSEGQDTSWPATAIAADAQTLTVLTSVSLPVPTYRYQKTCFFDYGGNTCIAAASAKDKSAAMTIYSLEGTVMLQKDVPLGIINSNPRMELSAHGNALRIEVINSGAAIISGDMKTASYIYENRSSSLLQRDGSGCYVLYTVNGLKQRVDRMSFDLKTTVWSYQVPYGFPQGIEFLRTDKDINEDGVPDFMFILNARNAEGQPFKSWFMAVSGADGSYLRADEVKTGEAVIDHVKYEYFLVANSMDIIQDIDADGIPELLAGDEVVGTRKGGIIGSFSGFIDAEGIRLDVGDANWDGITDYVVVSDKEARLYVSALKYSYGFVSVEYKKTDAAIAMDKDLSPMTTTGLIGDIDRDGVSEIVFIGYNDQGHEVFRVYSGAGLGYYYDLCRDGVRDNGEAFVSLGYDINGDGFNEIYGRVDWRNCIFSGLTGELLLDLSKTPQDDAVWDGGGVIVTYDTKIGYGYGEWYPDYLVPFTPMNEEPAYVMVNDADGDGLRDIAYLMTYWDQETFNMVRQIVTKSGATFEDISVMTIDPNTQGDRILPVGGSSDLIALVSEQTTTIADMGKNQVLAQFAIAAKSAMLAGDELLVSDSSGELYRLDLNKSFTINTAIPEVTQEHLLDVSWSLDQDNSIMTVSDNGTPVYRGNGDHAQIKLLNGEHDLTFSMDDGRGKTYSEYYHVSMNAERPDYIPAAAAAGVVLLICLFLGAFRRGRITRRFKGAAK